MPLRIEAKFFSHPILRFIWLCMHPLLYAFRPFIKCPRPVTLWEGINFLVQLAFDLLVLRFLGFKALAYLAVGTLLGLGPHPMTGHFISEHYLFADQQATHSYYGIWNPLIYNLGYHVEHHDFPYIAFTRLPELKRIAAEYYDGLPYHDSLCRVSPVAFGICSECIDWKPEESLLACYQSKQFIEELDYFPYPQRN